MDLKDLVSIGVDIVSIERISKNINDRESGFIKRVYTPGEINYCEDKNNVSSHYAGKLAAKEAVSKVLKMSWEKGVSWKDIEIANEENGVPVVVLHGEAKQVFKERKIKNILISISHEQEYAVAFALAVGDWKDER